MCLEFPFEYARIPDLGVLFYPIIRIELKTLAGWQQFEFLVDTGADVTTLPKSLLPALGVKTSKLRSSATFGVGGVKVRTLELELPIKLGDIEITVHASAVDTHEDVMPLLLGRKDIFESRFNLLIDSKRKMTVITAN